MKRCTNVLQIIKNRFDKKKATWNTIIRSENIDFVYIYMLLGYVIVIIIIL